MVPRKRNPSVDRHQLARIVPPVMSNMTRARNSADTETFAENRSTPRAKSRAVGNRAGAGRCVSVRPCGTDDFEDPVGFPGIAVCQFDVFGKCQIAITDWMGRRGSINEPLLRFDQLLQAAEPLFGVLHAAREPSVKDFSTIHELR